MPAEDEFVALRARAAARTQASQATLAAERARKAAAERSKREAAQVLEQRKQKAEREAAVRAEQRKRDDELHRRKLEEARAAAKIERAERERKLAEEKARGKRTAAKSNAASSSLRQDLIDSAKGTRSGSTTTLTREEQRARKNQAMWGEPAKRPKKKPPAPPATNRASMTPGRSLHISSALVGNRKNEMLAIGVGRQTYRSIEDVERELKAARASDDPAFVREAQRKQAELETLERRRKAMEKKRLMESGRKPNQSDDSLFGSDDEEQPDHKRALKSELKATIGSASSEQPEARAASKDRPSKSLATKSYGVNPADFLPGAPFRPLSSKGAAAKSEKPSDDEVRKTKQKLAVGGSRNAGKETLPVPEKVSIPARETPREKFIREDAERKALRREAQKAAGMIDRRPEAGRSQRYEESDGESEEEDSDDYESDGSEGESGASAGRYRKKSKRDDVRSQVWAALGMDRSKYESRDVYSDDDDMEADAASVYAEELRSARQARAEDRREEELERKRELAKAAKKRAREDRR